MASNLVEVVEAYFNSVNTGTIEQVARFIADDFESMSPRGLLNKEGLLAAISLQQTALPDFHVSLSDVEVADNVVTATENVRGTHDGVLDLSLVNGPVIQPTHKPIAFVMGRVQFTIVNGQIVTAHDIMPPSPEVGVPGLLKQIGYIP
ncbi:MAG: ester cyclase [Burkholderiales bacterium]|nr:ester cyclase [Anaerolineae bacterium]